MSDDDLIDGDCRVYFARCVAVNGADMEAVKIGCSWHVPHRLKSIEALVPFDCELIASVPGDMFLEYTVHMWFRADRIAGEYFRATPRVIDFIERAKATGKVPLRISVTGDDGPWLHMPAAIAFMNRHGLTVADVAAVSGSQVKSYQAHLEKAERPNRRFVAAMTVAALERGHRVFWPRDFNVSSVRKTNSEAA